MALPHLPTTYTTQKNIYETAMVHRRTQERDFREHWSNTARYFRDGAATAELKKKWESDKSFLISMNAYKKESEGETKIMNLKRRRLKLADMLAQEREQFQVELKNLNSGAWVVEDMKGRSESLKSAREEKRKQLADEKLYQHFRVNNPDLREIEQKQHEQHVISGWESQREEQKQREEDERRRKEEFEAELAEQQKIALQMERQREREKIKDEAALKEVLKEQMDELKHREYEAKELKRKEEMLMRGQWELGVMEEERRKQQKKRRDLEFGRVLLRQHTAALIRRSEQVQAELKEDLALLTRLAKQEEEEKTIRTARREKAKHDATWMKQVLEEQMRLEKTREAELDMLYNDEAQRMWTKRETEWAQERKARQRLMSEVMQTRQEQIASKMEAVKTEREALLREREELLDEMDQLNQMTQRDVEKEEEIKTARKQELEAQMSQKRQRQYQSLRFEAEELEKEKKMERDYDEYLRREARKMNIGDYEPKHFGRKQAWT